ncbi:hypothetical protein H6G89_32840 [Oscillatoria sp. FACHB-1407]|uniref:hypothetical protein n=1 Tax=Oscillatoria sp. FACHB-1407 TaxID=2692847 RepID=UPI0016837520|nr:hypothetical protein [Oscillatoria sp. FACHB-1407]MBD2465778.1 hypothetical protein [Oscillatoria sp. FACHB-1407]
MAFITPTQLFTGYQLLGSGEAAPAEGVFVPLTSLTNLTAGEANTSTGDARKVLFELCRTAFNAYAAMDAAARPSRMTITRATPTGVDASKVRQGYTITFDLDVSNADVAAES